MSAPIIRMPQEKCERLQQVDKACNLSVNGLIDEIYLGKPYQEEELLSRIAGFLKRAKPAA